MSNQFWLNLASRDLQKAKAFFIHLGFKMNDRHSAPHMVSMMVGDKGTIVNLFSETEVRGYMNHAVTNTAQSNEVLFSLGATSAAEVDIWAAKAVEAGGILYAKPGYKDGWMYGCGFTDLDGHRWNILFMDMSKLPKN